MSDDMSAIMRATMSASVVLAMPSSRIACVGMRMWIVSCCKCEQTRVLWSDGMISLLEG